MEYPPPEGHSLVINAETSVGACGSDLWQKIRARWEIKTGRKGDIKSQLGGTKGDVAMGGTRSGQKGSAKVTSRHVTPRHITSHHTTPHHITSHHITSHHITSHHTRTHCTDAARTQFFQWSTHIHANNAPLSTQHYTSTHTALSCLFSGCLLLCPSNCVDTT